MSGKSELEIAKEKIGVLLEEVESTREMQLRHLLTLVRDALQRARDGVPEKVEYKEGIDYTATQILRAQLYLQRCLEQLDKWANELPAMPREPDAAP